MVLYCLEILRLNAATIEHTLTNIYIPAMLFAYITNVRVCQGASCPAPRQCY